MNERALRRVLGVGVLLLVAGHVWDYVWHSRYGGEETGADALRAHFLIYAALAALAGVGAAALLRGGARAFFAAVAVAAAVALGGHGLDVYAHANDTDETLAHAASLVGEVAAIVLVVRSFHRPRTAGGRTPGRGR